MRQARGYRIRLCLETDDEIRQRKDSYQFARYSSRRTAPAHSRTRSAAPCGRSGMQTSAMVRLHARRAGRRSASGRSTRVLPAKMRPIRSRISPYGHATIQPIHKRRPQLRQRLIRELRRVLQVPGGDGQKVLRQQLGIVRLPGDDHPQLLPAPHPLYPRRATLGTRGSMGIPLLVHPFLTRSGACRRSSRRIDPGSATRSRK